MTLDVYRPARTTETLPAAVFIHGDLAEPELVRDIQGLGPVALLGRADRLDRQRSQRIPSAPSVSRAS
jgi:hypothetical protein